MRCGIHRMMSGRASLELGRLLGLLDDRLDDEVIGRTNGRTGCRRAVVGLGRWQLQGDHLDLVVIDDTSEDLERAALLRPDLEEMGHDVGVEGAHEGVIALVHFSVFDDESDITPGNHPGVTVRTAGKRFGHLLAIGVILTIVVDEQAGAIPVDLSEDEAGHVETAMRPLNDATYG